MRLTLDPLLKLRNALWLCVLGLSSLILGAPAAAQDYETGMTAFESGDFERAVRIWEPLAESGDPIAQYSLGKIFESGGGGVPKNYGRAVEWYRQAAGQGVPAAQNNLGLMYAQGRGVARDPTRAADFWRQAGESEHPIAQFNLGLAYFRGEGVAENKAAAEVWFRRAANIGLAEAQYALGQIKRLGLATSPDPGEALNWYQLAAAQGHDKAKEQASKLRRKGVEPKVASDAPPATVNTPDESAPPLDLAVASGPSDEPADSTKSMAEPASTATVQTETVPPAPAEPEAAEPSDLTVASGPAPEAMPAPPPPAPAVRPQVARAAAPDVQAGAEPMGAMDGDYQIWLVSMTDEAEAASFLQMARGKYPSVFGQAHGRVARVEFPRGKVFYRVVGTGLSDQGVARSLCDEMRREEPAAFCKVLAGGIAAN